MSQDEAKQEPVGKQVAGKQSVTDTCSDCSTCLRKPCGPSATMIEGIPKRSIGLVCQKSNPEHNEAFSSNVSFSNIDSYFPIT
ncbi:MAG: hypothetical protein PQJ48_08300 [Sphaerochaetaceae bacterium]|nr:hypothetical protein [Sphaerochaetaceae bacterium]